MSLSVLEWFAVTASRLSLRISVVLATLAGLLVPAAIAPAKTIVIPRTLARTASIGTGGSAHLDFPATHVAFSWHGEEGSGVRFRSGSDLWTSAPEAHDLEDGDVHYSGVLYVGDATEIQVEPLGWGLTPATEIRLHYMNTEDGPLRSVTVPAVADAAASTPDIVRRAEWGANESFKSTSGGCKRVFYPLQQLFVHHTAGSNDDPDPYATMRAIYHFHTQTRGWCDLGYNFVISQDGTIFEGRWSRAYGPWETPTSEDANGRVAAGAHVSGFNSGSLGVSMMGNFSTGSVPIAARNSLVQFLAWEADRHNLDPEAVHTYRNPDTGLTKRLPTIAGHRDGGSTDCPGDNLYRALPSIRREVALQAGSGRQNSHLTLKAAPRRVSFGDSTEVSGVLTDETGMPLAGRSITIYSKAGRARWTVLGQVMSSLEGGFRTTFQPERNTKVAAVYGGDAAVWEGQSRKKRVVVKPSLTLTATEAQSDLSGTYRYPAGSSRAQLAGSIDPALPGRYVKVLIFRTGTDGTETLVKEKRAVVDESGSFTTPFRFRDAGVTYRAAAWYEGGGGYAASRSNSVVFQREL